MLQFIKRLCSTGLTKSEYKEIYEKLQVSNRKNLCTFSIITSAILLLMIIVALVNIVAFSNPNSVAYQNIVAYIITFIVVVGILMYSKYCKKNILPAVYFFSGIILMFGIIIGTVTNPVNTAGCYVALLLAVPLVFVDKPFRNIIMILISNAIFIPMVILSKPQSTWANDLINSIVFGIISIVLSSYMMKIKLSEFKSEMVISKLANLDMMTGLFNRNYFERQLKEYHQIDAQSCFCVYVDADGLHDLNNEKGHESGDKMLIFIAKTLCQFFDNADVYRLGGDEFMVFGINRTEDQINIIVDEACKKIIEAGYSVSIGLEYQDQAYLNMESMVKCAETKMLKNKQKHYEQLGFDRRNSVNV